jgi:hypothetical protein
MPWYYAGPEEKPVGPVSTDELHARRRNGLLGSQTYIIEWNEEVGAVDGWKFYSEVFPVVPAMAPLPPPPPPPVSGPAGPHGPPPAPGLSAAPHAHYPPPSPGASQPHPLFPSAGHAPVPAAATFPHPASPHGHYPARRTNSWCAWGFGLGITGFVLSFACIGILIAVPALFVSLIGFAKVQSHREQSGRGLAVAGAVLSLLAIVISLGLGAWLLPPILKNHEWSVTEQSSTNSE